MLTHFYLFYTVFLNTFILVDIKTKIPDQTINLLGGSYKNPFILYPFEESESILTQKRLRIGTDEVEMITES